MPTNKAKYKECKIAYRVLITVIALVYLLPLSVWAGSDISIDSHTYFSMSEEVKGDEARDISTLYEYVSLNANNISGSCFSFVFSGWGKLETSDEKIGYEYYDRNDGDVTAAYIDYTTQDSDFNLRLGRQSVYTNLGYEDISGLSVRLPELSTGGGGGIYIGLSGYSGVPEELGDGSSSGDLISGAALSVNILRSFEIGIGYLTETDNDLQFRREADAELWMSHHFVEVYLKSIRNLITDSYSYRSAEANLYLTKRATFVARYDITGFEDYFTETELSIFDRFEHEEELCTAGGSLILVLSDNMDINLDYKDYDFKEDKGATAYGAGYKVSMSSVTTGLSYHKTDSLDEHEGYFDEYRLYVMYDVSKLSLSCDAIIDKFEYETFKRDTSTAIVTSAGYKFDDDFGVSVDLDYKRTPQYDDDYKVFVRVEYFL